MPSLYPPMAISRSLIQVGDATVASGANVVPSADTSNVTVPLASEIRHHRSFSGSYVEPTSIAAPPVVFHSAFSVPWSCVIAT